MSLPDVFDYAEYRKFLGDWFEAKKSANPRLSYRWFGRELGTKDPSALLNVTSGRRAITTEWIDAYVRVLELDGSRAEYFRTLVAFEDAPNTDAAERAWATLAALRSAEAAPGIGVDAFEFLSAWYIPAIHQLSHHPDFSEDPAWICRHLDPRISESDAQRAVMICVRLGFLQRRGDRLVYSEPTMRTAPAVQQLSSWPYHRDGLALAEKGLQRLRAGVDRDFIEDTVFLGGTFAIPATRVKEVRIAMFEMLNKMGAMTDAWTADADRVVHLSLSLVPVGRMDDPPEPPPVEER